REQCGLGRSRAYELMAIADGRTTLEKVRASTNERQKVHKTKSQSVITDRKPEPEPVAPRVTGSQEVDVEQHRARMAALGAELESAAQVMPPETAIDEVDRRVNCVTNTILRHVEGLSRSETERLLAALRSRIDEIERDMAEVVSLAEAAPSDRAALPADLSIPDFLKRTEAAA